MALKEINPVSQTHAGTAGKISEIIGCSAANGVQFDNSNPDNVVKAWANFPLLTAPAIPVYELSSPQLASGWDAASNALSLSWLGDIGYFDLYQALSLSPPTTWTANTNSAVFSNNLMDGDAPSG